MLLIPGLCGESVFLSVDHFHRPEETLHAESLRREAGGKGYNQAVAARRAGAEVFFLGAVGRDAGAALCREQLQKEGIGCRFFLREEATAYAAILTDRKGENRVTVYPGAKLSASDIEESRAVFEKADMLLITPEIPEDAFDRATSLALETRIPTVVNPAPFVPWLRGYLDRACLLTPNEAEARALLGLSEAEDLSRAAAEAPWDMVITLGARGALSVRDHVPLFLPAPKVHAVDTTGAGDCLNGVLCAGLERGMRQDEAAGRAVAAASLSVTRRGVMDALPRREEFDGPGVSAVYDKEE